MGELFEGEEFWDMTCGESQRSCALAPSILACDSAGFGPWA